MSLIDSDMFYWRQKKCFRMIDKVKNVATLIIYCSASEKKKIPPKPKPIYIIHRMRWGKVLSLSDIPFQATGQNARLQFSNKVMLFMFIEKKQLSNKT